MKFLVVLALTILSVAHAAIPKQLTCTSNAPEEVVEYEDSIRAFTLENFNTLTPDYPFGLNVMEIGLDGAEYKLVLSDECGTDITINFDQTELEELADGERESITGNLNYSSAALYESTVAPEGIVDIEITCK